MSDTEHVVEASGTNLAVVEESSFNAKTPPATGWHNLQANSYGQAPGGSFKKTPRDPITQSMQRQKGMLTDEDSGLAFETDITKDSLDRFAKGTFRSVPKHCGNKQQSQYKILGVTSTGYTVAALGDLAQRFLVCAFGCVNEANNGPHMVGAGSTGTETKTGGLVVESAPTNGLLELAGYRGTADDISLDSDGNLVSGGAIDFTTWHLSDFQNVFIGGEDTTNQFANPDFQGAAQVAKNGVAAHKITFQWRSWLVQQKSYLDLATVATNVDSVVQAQAAGPSGDAITVALVGDGDAAVKAFLALTSHTAHVDTVIQAKAGGAAGDSITVEIVTGAGAAAGVLTELGTHVKLQIKATATATTVAQLETLIGTSTLIEVKTAGTGATSLDATDAMPSLPLAAGADADPVSVVEVSSAVTVHFTPGTSTVAEIEAAIASDSTLIEIKTSGTAGHVAAATADEFTATHLAHGASGADDGAGKQIDVYFTRFFRQVAKNHADFAKTSYCFEETYPELYDGSPGYEYPRGNVLSETVFNIPLTSKATMNLTFVGTSTPNPTDTRKTGPADALDPNTNVGISTATDLAWVTIDDVDNNGVSTDLESLKITVKNNVTMQKKLGQLGGFLAIHGECEVSLEASMIFVSDAPIAAVRSNKTCRSRLLLRNTDFGAMFDVHAMTLDSDNKKIEKNKAVMLDGKGTGFQDDQSGSTLGLSMFAYLPPAITTDE